MFIDLNKLIDFYSGYKNIITLIRRLGTPWGDCHSSFTLLPQPRFMDKDMITIGSHEISPLMWLDNFREIFKIFSDEERHRFDLIIGEFVEYMGANPPDEFELMSEDGEVLTRTREEIEGSWGTMN